MSPQFKRYLFYAFLTVFVRFKPPMIASVVFKSDNKLCNTYTIVCPHVCGDNPRALASGLSPVHVD